MKKTLLLLAMFVCCDLICQSSGDYRTKNSGTWSAASNWETYNGTSWVTASTAPTSAHGAITILNGHTMTVASATSVDQTTIDFGGQVTVNGGVLTIVNGTGTDLIVNGTLKVSANNVTLGLSASITIGSEGVYEHNRSFVNGIPTATWNNGSTCLITSDITDFTTFNQSFWNLVINYSTGTSSRAMNSVASNIGVRNKLSIISTGSTGSITIGDGATVATLSIAKLEISGGIFYVGTGSGAHTLTCSDSLIINGGLMRIAHASNSGQIYIANAKDVQISSGTLDLNGYNSLSINAGRLILSGNLNINGGTLTNSPGITTGSAGIYFNGMSSQTYTHSGGTLSGGVGQRFYYKTTSGPTALNETYSGSSAQNTITGSTGTPASGFAAWPSSGTLVKNVIFNNSAGVTLSNARTINTTLQLLSGTINNSTNNINMASGTTIEKTNGSLSAAPVFAGTVNLLYSENATGITNSGNEVPTSVSVLNNVTLDNSNNVNLNSDMTINGIFDFNAGLLKCQNSKVLTFNQGSSHIGSGGLSYVVGKVSKIGNTAFTFPIGSDLLFRSASISAPSNSTDKFSAQYFRSNPTSLFGTGKDLTLNNVSKLEYWDVSRDIGTSSVSVSLDWESSTSGVSNSSDLRVAHWNSSLSKWEDLGKTNSITASSTSGFVTSNVTSNFSPFTLGSATAINPLPIELYDFDIFCYNNKLKFFWETKSEDNNHFYSILSSSDAINWSVLDTIKSKGNTSIGHQYEFLLDKKIDGKYFRLKQTDYDQKFELFPIKYFDSEMCLNYDHFTYYNQDKRTIIWNLVSDNYYFELIDYTGRVYLSGVTDLNYINTDKLNDGVYIFKLKVNGVHYINKIVIKKL
jgi:hypothetical protein